MLFIKQHHINFKFKKYNYLMLEELEIKAVVGFSGTNLLMQVRFIILCYSIQIMSTSFIPQETLLWFDISSLGPKLFSEDTITRFQVKNTLIQLFKYQRMVNMQQVPKKHSLAFQLMLSFGISQPKKSNINLNCIKLVLIALVFLVTRRCQQHRAVYRIST